MLLPQAHEEAQGYFARTPEVALEAPRGPRRLPKELQGKPPPAQAGCQVHGVDEEVWNHVKPLTQGVGAGEDHVGPEAVRGQLPAHFHTPGER